jgi:hypothetical protein
VKPKGVREASIKRKSLPGRRKMNHRLGDRKKLVEKEKGGQHNWNGVCKKGNDTR